MSTPKMPVFISVFNLHSSIVKSELSSVIIIGKKYTRKELKSILQKVYDEVLDLRCLGKRLSAGGFIWKFV